jgi:hypothetical protein
MNETSILISRSGNIQENVTIQDQGQEEIQIYFEGHNIRYRNLFGHVFALIGILILLIVFCLSIIGVTREITCFLF